MKFTLVQVRALKRLTSIDLFELYEALKLPFSYTTFEAVIHHDDIYRTRLENLLNRFNKTTARLCLECGHFENEGELIAGHYICTQCITEHYFISDYSESLFPNRDRVEVTTSNGLASWSAVEFDNHGWVCEDCGERFANSVDAYETDGRQTRSICSHCVDEFDYRHCNDCNHITQNPIYSAGNAVCRHCAEHYNWCETHEDYHHQDDNCDADDDVDEAPEQFIHSYATRVEYKYAWGSPIAQGRYLLRAQRNLYMGIELEVEVSDGDVTPNTVAGQLLADVETIICCEDGSLTQGFEIKTPPMNLAETKFIFESILASEAVEYLRSHNGGHCGLHINLSRAGLSQLQQAKLLFFFNSSTNANFLKAICRRFSSDPRLPNGSTNYSKVSGVPRLSEITKAWRRDDPIPSRQHTAYYSNGKGKVYNKEGAVNSTRYSAVNFTDTKVEIRLPRGTLKRNTLLANLELAAALTEFTRTGEMHAGSGRYSSELMVWLSKRPRVNKDFPELLRFCVDRRFLPATVLPKVRPLIDAPIPSFESIGVEALECPTSITLALVA